MVFRNEFLIYFVKSLKAKCEARFNYFLNGELSIAIEILPYGVQHV